MPQFSVLIQTQNYALVKAPDRLIRKNYYKEGEQILVSDIMYKKISKKEFFETMKNSKHHEFINVITKRKPEKKLEIDESDFGINGNPLFYFIVEKYFGDKK